MAESQHPAKCHDLEEKPDLEEASGKKVADDDSQRKRREEEKKDEEAARKGNIEQPWLYETQKPPTLRTSTISWRYYGTKRILLTYLPMKLSTSVKDA